MTHVSSKGVGFILVCVNPLPRISHHMTPSSHLHRPHGSSLSMEIYGKPETIWVPPDFPARPPFRVLQVLFVSTGTGSRHATSPEWFLWLSFWLDRFSSTAIRTFEVFQTSAYARNVSGLYPRTSPRALRFAFFKSSSYIPTSLPASRNRLLFCVTNTGVTPAVPPERRPQGPCSIKSNHVSKLLYAP